MPSLNDLCQFGTLCLVQYIGTLVLECVVHQYTVCNRCNTSWTEFQKIIYYIKLVFLIYIRILVSNVATTLLCHVADATWSKQAVNNIKQRSFIPYYIYYYCQ